MPKIIFSVLLFLSMKSDAQTLGKDSIPFIPAKDLILLSVPSNLVQLIPPKDTANNLIKNKNVTLEGGTGLKINLLSEVDSKSIKEGDIINFSVSEDVIVDKHVIIKAETLLTGTIEKAVAAKDLGKAGELGFSLNYVKAIDGTKIYLKPANGNIVGKKIPGSTVVITTIFLPGMAHKKGGNAKMEKGTIIQAFTDRDYTIQISKIEFQM